VKKKKKMDNKKGKSVRSILFAKNIGKAVVISLLLLLSTTFVASAQPPCYNVEVLGACCDTNCPWKTWGWFYNETATPADWEYSIKDCTVLFNLSVDGDEYWAYCTNYTVPLYTGDKFNASIYTAEPTCKNNSIAHILNNWTHTCSDCANVSAGQSAIWYFAYINDTFCSGGAPEYNHTADPPVESYWIPNCTAHSEACDFINASINESVPYNITLTPSTGSYVKGTPIPLEAEVDYCGVEEVVTVVFETDAGNFSESGTKVHENVTTNGKAGATLVCDAESANVTARVKDMKWFESVDPAGCSNPKEYQETLRIINITDDAAFTFYTQSGNIGIEKWVDDVKKEEVTYGQTVTYTLNITNTGVVDLTDIMVVDTLPADIIWADNASPLEDSVVGKVITWKSKLPPLLIPGDSFEINFNATVNESAECDKIYRNWATVNATTEQGEPVGPEESYADVFIDCPAEVPVLTPFGIAALIGLLSWVVVLSIRKKGKRG
jgi:uncharacterized repeat protein (TIGR01451 family)